MIQANAERDQWVRGWLEKSRTFWEFVKPKLDAELRAVNAVQADKALVAAYEARLKQGETPTRRETVAYLQAQSRELERIGSADGQDAGQRFILAMGQVPGLCAELKGLEDEAAFGPDFEVQRDAIVAEIRLRPEIGDAEVDLAALKADPSANLATLWTDHAPAWSIRLMTKAEREAVSRFCVEAARWGGPSYRNMAGEARACVLAVAIRTAVEGGREPTPAQVARLRVVLAQVPPNRLPAVLESASSRPVAALLSDDTTVPSLAAELCWAELDLIRAGV